MKNPTPVSNANVVGFGALGTGEWSIRPAGFTPHTLHLSAEAGLPPATTSLGSGPKMARSAR